MKEVLVIVNMQAGSTSDVSADMRDIFTRHGFDDPTIQNLDADELGPALSKLSAKTTDLLVIYGGDGTCKAGAIAARREGIPLIVLPGGTMNILPNALYRTMDWKTALEIALKTKTPRWIPCGHVNDEVFFVGLLMGDPVIMADMRENIREGQLLEATRKIPDVMASISQGENFEYYADGKPFQSDANILNVLCPIDPKVSPTETRFEFSAAPNMSFMDIIDIGTTALIDGWKNSELIETGIAEKLTIRGQGDFNTLLDGEPARISCPITITLDPRGVKVLAPAAKDVL